jgi:signal transduction histidine kinase
MMVGRRRVSAVTILVGVVMLLVPTLAWMQYQWLGQLSTAERERMQRTLRTAAAQFATEFDTEMSRTLVSLQVDAPGLRDQNWAAYAQRYSLWATSATEPRLVRDVWLVDTLPGTPLTAVTPLPPSRGIPVDRLRIRRWNAQSLAFEGAPWPDDLRAMRASLASRLIGITMRAPGSGNRTRGGETPQASWAVSPGDDNTLVAPVTSFDMGDHQGPPKIAVIGFTIVRLDPAVVRDSILAALTQRHFHGGDAEVDYRVAVVKKDEPRHVIWESEPGIADQVTSAPDVEQTFMGARPDQMLVFTRNFRSGGEAHAALPPLPPQAGKREPGTGSRLDRTDIRDNAVEMKIATGSRLPGGSRDDNVVVSVIERETRRGGGRGERMIAGAAGQLNTFNSRWVLMAKHRSGSLEAAVAQVRTRNLFVSSGILMLLTVVIGLIAVSARRAQELARQQLEFVAAVSHELRTPVSVIGAAAGNLADGVVGDPQRVRKYGETIQGEARRLGETVERVLQLAGIAAGSSAAAQRPVAPAELVRESIHACRLEIDAAGVTVETSIADDLPMIVGDVSALRSALQNLISNAVKYGGNARWLRVAARREPGAGSREQVLFTVEDRGLGIDSDDRKRIFEPFYRGREAVAQQIQGSGLGLNLVMRIAEAHGGKVSVASEPGKGSTFTLALPATRDRAASEPLPLAREATAPR